MSYGCDPLFGEVCSSNTTIGNTTINITVSNGTGINIGGIDPTISSDAFAYVLHDTYNAVYGLVQVVMAAYGFALYYYENQARSSISLPAVIYVTSFFFMGIFGFNSLIFIANYLFDLKGGFLHEIFAKS